MFTINASSPAVCTLTTQVNAQLLLIVMNGPLHSDSKHRQFGLYHYCVWGAVWGSIIDTHNQTIQQKPWLFFSSCQSRFWVLSILFYPLNLNFTNNVHHIKHTILMNLYTHIVQNIPIHKNGVVQMKIVSYFVPIFPILQQYMNFKPELVHAGNTKTTFSYKIL